MAIWRKQGLTVVILLGLSAFLTVALNFSARTKSSPADLRAIPEAIGNFVGADLPVDESVKDILETPNVLMRDYVSPDGLHVMVSIVYYERYRVDFHMPEGCMVGRGSIIVDSSTESLSCSNQSGSILVNSLLLKQRKENEHVLYYFLVGDYITPSYAKMRLRLMTHYLLRKPTSAALVRFSVRLPDGQNERLQEFKDFVVHMTDILPSSLIPRTT